MVIRCSNCNSAYAVNDSKVENKKFAFNCPNCSAENIIDNRGPVANVVATGVDTPKDSGKKDQSTGMEFQGPEESTVLTDNSASTEFSEETDIPTNSKEDTGEDLSDNFADDLGNELTDDFEDFGEDLMADEPVVDQPLDESLDEPIDENVLEEESILTNETIADDSELSLDEELSEDLSAGDSDPVQDKGVPEDLSVDESELSLDEDLSVDDFGSEISVEDESLSEMPDLDEVSSEDDIIAHEESLDLSDAEDLDLSLDEEKSVQDDTLEGAGDEIPEISEGSAEGIEDELDLDFDLDDLPDTSDTGEQEDELDLDLSIDEETELQTPSVVQDELDMTEEPDISDFQDEISGAEISEDIQNEIIDESEIIDEADNLKELEDIDIPSSEITVETKDDIDIMADIDDLPDIDFTSEEEVQESGQVSKDTQDLKEESKIDTILDDMPVGVMTENEIEESEPESLVDDSYISVEGEDSSPGLDGFAGAETADEESDDDSITIDLDSLDIEFEEGDDFEQGELVEENIEIDIPENIEEELEIDIPENLEEELEIDIPGGIEEMDTSLPVEAVSAEGDLEDEDTTLDLDSLDLDIDEDTTLDLDSLDLDIDEDNVVMAEGESPDNIIEDDSFKEPPLDEATSQAGVEDEDTTLDLDSLDIALVESEDVHSGESYDEEDEKLTLEDAGLTIEELTSEEAVVVSALHDGSDEDVDEDIKLTIDEIDPSLNVDNIGDELGVSTAQLEDEFEDSVSGEDDMLEVELDESIHETVPDDTASKVAIEGTHIDDELIELEDSELAETGSYEKIQSKKEMIKKVARGSVNFSIDYSLKYSRRRGLFRLLGLYFIALVPHFIVFFIYSVLSLILGFINHIIVGTTGSNIEDFAEIQENTIRYYLSICATFTGIIDEYPVFTGRDDIDYPLQLDITYPLRYSRLLAALRLSIVGILFINLPHLIILGLLTFAMPIISLIGIVSVIISGRWPHYLFDILSRYYTYFAKVLAFTVGLVDSYPPFDFK
jgi:DNA-directed RNA polymerase subunit M/transcription elongation factor TFIIS